MKELNLDGSHFNLLWVYSLNLIGTALKRGRP
jgi:hypothetical protein